MVKTNCTACPMPSLERVADLFVGLKKSTDKKWEWFSVKTTGNILSRGQALALRVAAFIPLVLLSLFTYPIGFLGGYLKDRYIPQFAREVRTTLEKAEEIPGVPNKDKDAFKTAKDGMLKRWDQLVQDGAIVVKAVDKDVRPDFVGVQIGVEHVLANLLAKEAKAGEKVSVRGVIHTPMPATPFCTKGEVTPTLASKEVAEDAKRAATIPVRANLVRTLVAKGAIMDLVYTEEGYNKRTEDEKKILEAEVTVYPKNLLKHPLQKKIEEVKDQWIGATYFVKLENKGTYVFSIQMTQAKNPKNEKEEGEFGVWFGRENNPEIQKRLKQVQEYVPLKLTTTDLFV